MSCKRKWQCKKVFDGRGVIWKLSRRLFRQRLSSLAGVLPKQRLDCTTWEQLIIEYNKAAVEANKEVVDAEAQVVANEY